MDALKGLLVHLKRYVPKLIIAIGIIASFTALALIYTPKQNQISTVFTVTIAAADSSAQWKSQATVICDGTADQTEIQAAINSNVNVTLAPGNYYFSGACSITSKNSFTLAGQAGTNIIVNSSTNAFPVTSCSNFTFDGLDIRRTGSDAESRRFFYITASTNGTIKNCRLHDAYSIIDVRSNNSTHVKSTDISILNNEIYNYHYQAINAGNGVERIYILNNNFHDATRYAGSSYLYTFGTPFDSTSDTVSSTEDTIYFCNNIVNGQDLHNALDLHGGNNIHVNFNRFSNLAGKAVYYHSGPLSSGVFGNIEVLKNTFDGVVDHCIHLENATANCTLNNINISGNISTRCTRDGIYISSQPLSGCAITNISIYGNSYSQPTGNYRWASGIEIAGNSTAPLINGIHIIGNTVNGATTGQYKTNVACSLNYSNNAVVVNNVWSNTSDVAFYQTHNTGLLQSGSYTAPTVTTTPASNITTSTAAVGGSVTNRGTSLNASSYFEYGTTSAYGSYADVSGSPSTTTGNRTATLSNLLPQTLYHFRLVSAGDGISYGPDLTFTTT